VSQRRLSKLLGLSPEEAVALTDQARARLGSRAYALRLAAFLVATAPVARRLIPLGARRRAIRPFVYGLVPGPAENLVYAGVLSPHPRLGGSDGND
jgi:hypothetical protein